MVTPMASITVMARKVTRQMVMDAGEVDVMVKDALEIYKGDDILRRVLLPKLRNAAGTVVTRRTVS